MTLAISIWDHLGQNRSVSERALSGSVIETNDSGPVGADGWWLLFGPEDPVIERRPEDSA